MLFNAYKSKERYEIQSMSYTYCSFRYIKIIHSYKYFFLWSHICISISNLFWVQHFLLHVLLQLKSSVGFSKL